MTDASVLRLLKSVLRNVTKGTECGFRFCQGPNVKPEPMVTCHRCFALYDLRRRIQRLEFSLDKPSRTE